jgi:redox-sensitive bicupin YhaK (pirin superfamily)
MLDEFHVAKPGGFPDHPHRGFETVTWMKSGVFQHEDFAGHSGKIGPGDVQWMTAGKGIVHAEMPFGDEPARGLQLWVNLPKADKLSEPRYQEFLSKDIPKVEREGIQVKVIAGESFGVRAKVSTRIPIVYLIVNLDANTSLEQVTLNISFIEIAI